MPLHLLSKKSWNVYNPAAIARVRADEAAAAAREEAQEQQLQEYEAAKRLAILRGQTPPEPPAALDEPAAGGDAKPPPRDSSARDPARHDDRLKRRKLAGEDDTDRDIRVAREAENDRVRQRDNTQLGAGASSASHRGRDANVPLVDHAGHIQLFAPPSTREIRAQKDAEAEAEKKRRQTEHEDQVTMRFANAAGFRNAPQDVPWYAKRSIGTGRDTRYTGTEEVDDGQDKVVGRNAFGNEDPGRINRDKQRMSAADPMAAMAKAQRTLKQVQSERETLRRERERDLQDLVEMQSRAHRKEHRRRSKKRDRSVEDEGLEGFSLDDNHYSSSKHRTHSRSHHREDRRSVHSRDRKTHRSHRIES